MRHLSAGAMLALVILGGCAPHKVTEEIPPPDFTPSTFSRTGDQPAAPQWWTVFQDSELDALMEEALTQNLDLAAAWARLNQAEALAVQAGAALAPEVNAGTSARRGRSVIFNQAQTANTFGLSLTASYEVDLWKRLSSRQKAGRFDLQATREDVESTAMTLSAAVASAWFNILEQREQLTLLNEQVDVNRKLLEVIETRFTNASATAVDVFQQREQVASVEAQIPPAEARLAVAEHQLAVLAGKAPKTQSPANAGNLPELPPLPNPGPPITLLQNRPDIRASAARVAAADYRMAEAIAARYPSLRLTGEAGFQASDLEDIFDDWIWNLAANLVGPLLDGRRREAEVDRTRSVLRERLVQYQQTTLTAFQEVEDALIQEAKQAERLARLKVQLEFAESALDSGRARYLRGVGNFLTVLTEIQAVQRIQREIIAGKRASVSHRVNLYKAIGGTWTKELEQPTSHQQIGAEE